MHHIRKSNHRKMLKPKFYSSSSDDDTEDAAPLKWKPIIATFPIESKDTSKQLIQSNPIIDSLNSQTSKQQKLSAEVIQKEEIYNQAEMEANKRMFGCANPGRCLSKDEIRRRKDMILHIVNERLKSKLSELMGEFGERLEMNDTYSMKNSTEDEAISYRNRSPIHDDYDDDSLPEAPPPPTFNTSSESSDNEMDVSITKEFELYEKEIKEKISDENPSKIQTHAPNVATSIVNAIPPSPAVLNTSAYNSTPMCSPHSIPLPQNTTPVSSALNTNLMSQNWNILQQTSMNYQQNWQQMQQWSVTAQQAVQSVDMTPWIPPVGPPQIMDPFPPPIEAEQMSQPPPTQLIPTFIHTNPPPSAVWMPPSFSSNYGSVPQFPNPEWAKQSQSTPFTGRASNPIQRPPLRGQPAQRMRWTARGGYRSSGPYVRPGATDTSENLPNVSVRSAQNQMQEPLKSPNNVNTQPFSKSNFVDADVRKLLTPPKPTDSNANFNHVNNSFIDEQREKRMEHLNKFSNSQKRPYKQQVDNGPCDVLGNSLENRDHYKTSNNDTKRARTNAFKVRKSRFNAANNIQNPTEMLEASLEHQTNPRNGHKTSLERRDNIGGSKNIIKSPQLDARHEKTNAETLKFLTKFWNGKNNESTINDKNSRNFQNKQPLERTRLCEIVDKLLDLSPRMVKELPVTDRRMKERNEILVILSDDPAKFYDYVDKYGEENVNWSVKRAQSILYPQDRCEDRKMSSTKPSTALFQNAKPNIGPLDRCEDRKMSSTKPSTAPFQNAKPNIGPLDRCEDRKMSSTKPLTAPFENAKPNIGAPKEWIKICKIVDKLLDIPTHIVENLSSSDSIVLERNEIIMVLSGDPEDLLLYDEKFGSHNVNNAILAAKRVLAPHGEIDERIRKIMLRQRKQLMVVDSEPSRERSTNSDRESHKRSNNKNTPNNDDHRSRSIPKEWNKLCDIVDKVLDTPYEVRIKLSKKDPRWEQRDNILLVLSSDDPDQLLSQSNEYGPVNVDWAVKSAKKITFPNGSKDNKIVRKLSPQRNLLLRNRQSSCVADEKMVKKTESATIKTNNPVKAHPDKRLSKENEVSKDDQISKHNHSSKEDKSPKGTKIIKEVSKESHISKENKTVKSHQLIKEQILKADNLVLKKPDIETKVSVIPTVSTTVEVDENEVWKKLCTIVDKLLDLPVNVADKLPTTDKRLVEKNDILLILSEDPGNFSKFDGSYGAANVSWAIKSAKKLIYLNERPNEKLIEKLWKKRDAIVCSDENYKQETKDSSKTESDEWMYIRKIATKMFQYSTKHLTKEKKQSKESIYNTIELLLQLSHDPDIVRTKSICKKIGEGRVEVAIAKCKHILNRMRKMDPKALVNFEHQRCKMVLYFESQDQSKKIKNYDVILEKVRSIIDQKLFYELFGDNFNKWTNEQKLERNELAILMIKDPSVLKSNAKYLEMVLKTEKGDSADIIADVEQCLRKCENVKEKPIESEKSQSSAVSAPIIAKIKDEKYMSTFKERKLTQRIHRLIEQFLIAPKPEVFDVRFDETDGTVGVVCANLMTFKWLQKSVHELDGLWPNGKLTITKAPITRKVLRIDDLKQIKMTFKSVPTESFEVLMKKLKKSNPKLNTERWQSIPSNFTDGKKVLVMVDLESLIELERSKREINMESGTIYFDIKYIGKENFDTKC